MKILPGCCNAAGKGVAMPPPEVVSAQAGVLKALADPARIRIVYALCDGELCVCEIMKRLDMPQTMVSHHCKILKVAGVVSDRKQGKWVYYHLADERVPGMLEMLNREG